MSLSPRRISTILVCLAASLGAQDPDPALARELAGIFERPAGTTISAEQKAELAAFVERHRGGLGALGYAVALDHYLRRDVTAAVAALDRFFARYDAIGNEEHAAMAGRIYLNAVYSAAGGRESDEEAMLRHAERMAALYPDARLVARALEAVARKAGDERTAAIELAVVRGILASDRSDRDKVAALRAVLGEGTAGDRTPTRKQPTDLEGQQAPPLQAEEVIGGPDDLTLAGLRGKVVVLDFWATWCPPCRAGVPGMIGLQEEFGDRVQVLGVTRLYGHGMDFSGDDVTLPHGGETAKDLDRAQELAVIETFAEAFDVPYPLVVVPAEVTSKAYGVTGIPTMVVLDEEGIVRGRFVGNTEKNERSLHELVTRLAR